MLDPWTAKLVNNLSECGGLESEEGQATLELVASLAKMDVLAIEKGHASVRRRLFSRGVQTHAESLEQVSAEFVLDRVRQKGQAWPMSQLQNSLGTPVIDKTSAAPPVRQRCKRRRCGGRLARVH